MINKTENVHFYMKKANFIEEHILSYKKTCIEKMFNDVLV